MIIIILGSRALKALHTGFDRIPNDLDILCEYEDMKSYCKRLQTFPGYGKIKSQYPIDQGKKFITKYEFGNIIEAEICWRNSNSNRLKDLILKSFIAIEKYEEIIPSTIILYILKNSHKFLRNSPHFLKTMNDICWMEKTFNFNFDEIYKNLPKEIKIWYNDRVKETYNYSHPKLDVSKNDFFNGDGVRYIYDHDSIHEAIKRLEFPAYTYFKSDASEVNCSKELFNNLQDEIKKLAVLEEVEVLALERSQIPFPFTDARKSFNIAHEKVCTSITSGWFRDFAYNNYHKVQKMYNENYVTSFKDKVLNNSVKLYNQS